MPRPPPFPKTALKGKKSASARNPVTVKLGISAEIFKGRNDAPYVEAIMTVLLETSPEKISAKVLKAESAKK